MRCIGLVIGAALLTLSAACGAAPNAPVNVPRAAPGASPGATWRVLSVADGDTLTVTNSAGDKRTVRVLGIDTPETKDPRKPVMCGGAEASAFAQKQLAKTTVTLETDPSQGDVDKYGRTLAYVTTAAGEDYGLTVLQRGLGAEYTYRRAYARQVAYRAAQAASQASKTGVWGKCGGITTPVKKTTGYASCAEVRKAGKAPIHAGDPGWNPRLDRNHDGVACA